VLVFPEKATQARMPVPHSNDLEMITTRCTNGNRP
jgi:hypothetical protein